MRGAILVISVNCRTAPAFAIVIVATDRTCWTPRRPASLLPVALNRFRAGGTSAFPLRRRRCPRARLFCEFSRFPYHPLSR